MDWLGPLAPYIKTVLGTLGALAGAWLVYRQTNKQTDAQERTAKAQTEADADAIEAQTYVDAMNTVTSGFTALLDQQRQTLELRQREHEREREHMAGRIGALEGKHADLERKVEHLQEQQRADRRWKAVAIEYIRDLWETIRDLGHVPPAAPEEISPDLEAPRPQA
ncbi:hypothetical protein ACIP9H_33635 [Streptomyces sp. NPDC088732]|uniref:hypothetical protein n=1 Tax=Streptomyces sp. NPDC088732 TaxID=3365879 RepID=UPI00382DB047